jgi:catechol 2,3-dioxygenase-like lactoylglutathione lyase family enzyme
VNERPQIECEQHHPGLTVADIPAAVDFYTTKLGFQLDFTWGEPATFAGVHLDKVQIFLQQGMSLSSCVEEILLHTNDGVEPHTKSQLARIRKLKQKHGIDYDTHASYGWVERGEK